MRGGPRPPSRLVAEVLHARLAPYLYPLAGRLVHLGLAGLLARARRSRCPTRFRLPSMTTGWSCYRLPVDWPALLPHLIGEATHSAVGRTGGRVVLASLNATEMARRRFREIARLPGSSSKATRASSAADSCKPVVLTTTMFAQYDPDNLLLAQARAGCWCRSWTWTAWPRPCNA